MKIYKNRQGSINLPLTVILGVILIAGIIAFEYARVYGSRETITVTVTDKTVKRYDDKDKYLIYTDAGTFEITDEVLAGRFNSSDDYGKIQIGETYEITVCGWRVPVLSWYKNIIKVNK